MDIDALKAKGDAALAQISNALDDLQYSPDQRPVPLLHLAMDYVRDMQAILATASEQAPVAYQYRRRGSGHEWGNCPWDSVADLRMGTEFEVRELFSSPAHTSEARDAVLRGVRELALKAAAHWDSDEDMKVGKTLMALAGQLPNYDKRADAFDAAMRQEADDE